MRSRCCGRCEPEWAGNNHRGMRELPRGLERASRSWTKDVKLAFAAAKRHSTCAFTPASVLALLSAETP